MFNSFLVNPNYAAWSQHMWGSVIGNFRNSSANVLSFMMIAAHFNSTKVEVYLPKSTLKGLQILLELPFIEQIFPL